MAKRKTRSLIMATTAPETATPKPQASKPRSGTTPKRTRATPSDNGAARASGLTQGRMLGIAAAGVIAGLAASIGRKAVVQAASALSGDWLDALKTEHKLALGLLDKMAATRDSQTTKRAMLLMQLKHALAKHAFQEENVIYPALRDHDEREEADRLNHDHGYVKQFLYELTELPKSSSAWTAKIREFHTALEKHIREEEEEIFPALRARLGAEENSHLTTAMNKEGFKLA
jgi:hemerythrin superfamily protein